MPGTGARGVRLKPAAQVSAAGADSLICTEGPLDDHEAALWRAKWSRRRHDELRRQYWWRDLSGDLQLGSRNA